MTYQEFWSKYNELKAQIDDHLRDEAKRILSSGSIDREAYDDDYQLPKIILTAALLHEADSWSPITRAGKRAVKNIGNF